MASRVPKPSREQLPVGEVLCDYCVAKCCRYFSLPIDPPTTPREFDDIRWYLLHEHAALFTDDDQWYLVVNTPCRHLQPDHRCGIYETRPQVCREYSTDRCEYDDQWTFEGSDRYFETPEQLAEYAEAIFPKKPGQSWRSPRPKLLPII